MDGWMDGLKDGDSSRDETHSRDVWTCWTRTDGCSVQEDVWFLSDERSRDVHPLKSQRSCSRC